NWPRGRTRTASHCVRLGTLDAARRGAIIREVRDADLGIATLPITNLYLQGWEHPVATPRGLPPLRELLDVGVRVGAGADNVRDPFNPVGRSDALETASLLVTAGHLSPAEAYDLVSHGARSVMGLAPAGAVPGAQADFLAIRAANLADATASAPAERIVIHRGRVVAATEVRRVLPSVGLGGVTSHAAAVFPVRTTTSQPPRAVVPPSAVPRLPAHAPTPVPARVPTAAPAS
ncbi:MAG: amidohydrolase family protein, partial [Sinomonas sp.]|nr:amidohydrolase family protein [Sinomonas sp.]